MKANKENPGGANAGAFEMHSNMDSQEYSENPDSIQVSTDIVLAEIWKSGRELIRVSLSEYKGSPTVNLRVWMLDAEDNEYPTKNGLTCSRRHVHALAEALVRADRIVTADASEGGVV